MSRAGAGAVADVCFRYVNVPLVPKSRNRRKAKSQANIAHAKLTSSHQLAKSRWKTVKIVLSSLATGVGVLSGALYFCTLSEFHPLDVSLYRRNFDSSSPITLWIKNKSLFDRSPKLVCDFRSEEMEYPGFTPILVKGGGGYQSKGIVSIAPGAAKLFQCDPRVSGEYFRLKIRGNWTNWRRMFVTLQVEATYYDLWFIKRTYLSSFINCYYFKDGRKECKIPDKAVPLDL